jgi:hypothetical protein
MGFLLVLVALVVVLGGAVGAVALAARARNQYRASNQVVPGRPTQAPASWAGSHDPEAILHRRLRDAMAALRANQAFDHDGVLLDVRVELEEQALALDEQLVAVAALPRLHRAEPLALMTEAVSTIEKAVADLASRSAREAGPRLQEVLHRIHERTSLVEEIRTELDRLPAAPGATRTPTTEPGPTGAPGPSGGIDSSGETGTAGTTETGPTGTTGTGSAF